MSGGNTCDYSFLFEHFDFLISNVSYLCREMGPKLKPNAPKPLSLDYSRNGDLCGDPSRLGSGRAQSRVSSRKTQAALTFGPYFFTPRASQEANHHCFALTALSNLACFFPTSSGLASVLATLQPQIVSQTHGMFLAYTGPKA